MFAIDTHAHVFQHDLPCAADARYKPHYDALLDDWLKAWPAAGVAGGVLVQPSFLGTDNRYLLQQIERMPHCLRGVAVVAADIGSGELRAMDRAGVRGIRLNLVQRTEFAEFAQHKWQAVFGTISNLGWHLEVQCQGAWLADLLAALGRQPAPLVIDHFGLPPALAVGTDGKGKARGIAGTEALLLTAQRHPLYVKLSGHYRFAGDAAQHARRLLAELGPERLLWGSDWPWTNHESANSYLGCMDRLREWVPDEEARRRILEDTPARLFGFTNQTPAP